MPGRYVTYFLFIEKHFLLLVLFSSIAALVFPHSFLWVKPHIPKLLGVIMFGMGVTLKFSDFLEVWERKGLVFLGVVMQYTIMPVFAVIISFLFHLPKELMIGMVIVGSCPGGTASNVIAYMARANVALSVTLTLFSTFLAPLLTPGIIYFILSKKVAISLLAMMKSVFWIVLFPLVDGLIIRHFFQKRLESFISIFPSISVLSIILIIACVVALNQRLLMDFPYLILLAVMLHNVSGLVLGYGFARFFRASKNDCRTLAIEIGMQNSGLGVSLATQFFSSASALAGAIFSVWHNISGIVLADYWSKKK